MRNDEQLQRDVLEELEWDASIDASMFGVTANNGVVTLSGHVPTLTDRLTAEKLTKRVRGVRAVANEVAVRPSDSHHRDDEHIAAAAVHALDWNGKVPKNRIQVVVSAGWIALDGSVDHRFERAAAERAVRHMAGVRGVTNRIAVEPRKTVAGQGARPGEIKDAIERAVRRSATVNLKKINVEVVGNRVTLTGDARSNSARDEAERIAWMPHEVTEVENYITITPWGCGPPDEWGY